MYATTQALPETQRDTQTRLQGVEGLGGPEEAHEHGLRAFQGLGF